MSQVRVLNSASVRVLIYKTAGGLCSSWTCIGIRCATNASVRVLNDTLVVKTYLQPKNISICTTNTIILYRHTITSSRYGAHAYNSVDNILISSSSDESPGVGLSLNRSQHDAALPSTTPRQERKSSTDYSEPRHRTEVNSDLRSRDARVKRTASISAIQMGFDVAPHVMKRD